jgi:hypothetical protein
LAHDYIRQIREYSLRSIPHYVEYDVAGQEQQGRTMTTISEPISNAVLSEAISLRISECYGAMDIANRLGGSPSVAWKVARAHRLAELVADALDRGIDVRAIKAAVDKTAFCDTKAYLRVREEIGGRADFPA